MSQDRYTYLIYQELQNTLTAEESIELKHWIDTSPANALIKEQIATAMKVVDRPPSFEVDVKADYAKVAERLGTNPQLKAGTTANGRWKLWLIIAALLIGIGTAGYFYSNHTKTPVLRAMITQDQVQEILLADGSKVKLNVGSSLSYPEVFDGSVRSVKLVGEGYFEIAKDETKPFIITTARSKVEVLGTSFNVREYDESSTTVAVLSGKVKMTNLYNDESLILTAKQKGIIDSNQKLSSEDNENLNALAWDTGQLRFKSTPLGRVFGEMALFYDISILNKSEKISKCNYSMTTQSISLDNMLKNLQVLYHFDIERKANNVLVVSGGDCNN